MDEAAEHEPAEAAPGAPGPPGAPGAPGDAVPEKRNFVLGVLNGAFYMMAMAFIQPQIVLSAFAKQMTGTNVYAGLLSSVNMFTWRVPQLVVSRFVEGRERKLSFYILSSVLRVGAWVAICVVVLSAAELDKLSVFWIFFGLYVVAGLSSGLGGVPFQDIVAKIIPERKLGKFFSIRVIVGRGGSLISVTIAAFFVLTKVDFPYNYGLLFVCYTVFAAMGTLAFCGVKEPPGIVAKKRRPWRELLLAGPRFLRDNAAFRGLFLYRAIRMMAMMSTPLYALYAGVDKTGGWRLAMFLYANLSAQMFGGVIANWISGRWRPTVLMVVAAAGSMAAPALALATPYFGSATLVSFGSGADALALTGTDLAFVAVFVLNGLSGIMGMIAASTYLLTVSPPKERPICVASFNTMLLPFFIIPRVAAGGIADLYGYETAIAPCVLFAALSLVFALRLARRAPATGLASTYGSATTPPQEAEG